MGFWSGLTHGTLVSAAALAALSLAVPRDRDGPGAARVDAVAQPDSPPGTTPADSRSAGESRKPDAAPVDTGTLGQPDTRPVSMADQQSVAEHEQGVIDDEKPSLPQETAAPTETGEPSTQNAAVQPAGEKSVPLPAEGRVLPQDVKPVTGMAAPDTLPDPIGSEFRRAGDDMPQRPALQNAPETGAAPVAVPAATETAPSLASGPDAAPHAPATPGLLPSGLLAGEALPTEPRDAAQAELARPAVAAPGKVMAPALDQSPGGGLSSADEPAPESAPAAPVAVPTPALTADARPAGGAGFPAVAEALAPLESPDAGAPAQPVTTPVQDRPAPALSLPAAPLGSAAAVPERAGSRPAPDLSVPVLSLGDAGRRVAPPLARPDAASPAQPDLTDIKPGATP